MKREEFKKHIAKIEKTIGYTFRDKSLLIQAFTRTSFCNERREHGRPPYQSNEVLEFFGDSVLSLSIITYLLSEKTERYEFGIRTELAEGDFSNIKSKLSDKKNLSASTLALGLERFLIMGDGDEKLGIEKEPSVMEDLFESIIGAVYIDTGMDVTVVMRVVKGMLDMSIYKSSSAASVSAKNALQEWCADKSRRLPPPIYETLGEEGPDHKKVYERGVYVGGKMIARAKGKNLKTADTACAELALRILTEGEKKEARAARPKEDKPQAVARPAKKAKELKKEALPPSAELQEASARLKRITESLKLPIPRYRDLGEVSSECGKYRVECKVGDVTELGVAEDRKTARDLASLRMLKALAAERKTNTKKSRAGGKK